MSEAFHPAAVHLARPPKLPFETDLQDRRSAAPEGNWPFIGGGQSEASKAAPASGTSGFA
jgi:hypothetical protein